MFEKFTQKAIDIVQNAQIQAQNLAHDKIYSEHLLLGLVSEAKGVQAKIMGYDKIDVNILNEKIRARFKNNTKINTENVNFSESARNILEKTIEIAKNFQSSLILPQHISLAILYSPSSGAYQILKEFEIDEEKIIPNLKRLIQKNSPKAFTHPENVTMSEEKLACYDIKNLFKEKNVENILNNAASKLTAFGYEILGTEQIFQSILDSGDSKITEILNKNGIDKETFTKKLESFTSRADEFEDNNEKQIVFTPNALKAMLLAVDTAKELGSVEIKGEHIVLGMLKSKTGIAYKILKDIVENTNDFEDKITYELNAHSKQTPETLAILRLAKQEAAALDKTTIGTEMILLGILAYGIGAGAQTLYKLGITLKDARVEVENLVGNGVDPNEQFSYTPRAKKMLQCAYEAAKRHNKTKIVSENLLYAITKQPDCLAMKALENMGTDVLEIKQGILKEINSQMENLQI